MMTQQTYDATLRTGTSAFIRNICETLRDMADTLFAPDAKLPEPSTSQSECGLTLIAHFFGAAQGEFLLSTTEFTAAGIAGKYTPGTPVAAIVAHREIYTGLLCEVLNISAHKALPVLGNAFGKLWLLPPAWVYGEYHTVDYISGIGLVKGIQGAIRCSLILNMVQTPPKNANIREQQ